MTKTLEYLKPYWKQIILVITLLLVQAIANLYLPNLNASIINEGITKGDIHHILRTGGLMLIVTLLLGLCSVISVYWGSKTAMAFGRDLRRGLFGRVQEFSKTELDSFGTPSLITRTTNDVQQVQMAVVMALNIMISAPVMGIGGIIMALRQDVPLSISIIVIVPVMGLILALIMRDASPLFRSMQTKIDRLNQVVQEKLSGVRVIRAFVKTDYEERRFDEANLDLTSTALGINRLMAFTMPLMMLVVNLSMVAIMWFGAYRVDSGALPIGNLTAFLAYMIQILMSVMMSVMMFVMIPRAAASAERIQEVLEKQPSISPPPAPVTGGVTTSSIEFQNVEFTYPGAEAPVLRDISFRVGPGETTAIIGSTGCGKSTLINLIPRLYDVTGGRVLVDGVDVRDWAEAELRKKIGFVPQQAFLFSGTVASNLRYGQDSATDEELWHALAIAQAASFVREMSGQLDAPVAQGGANLSGGQKQRLAIARALLRRPDIYIFDDSFSALDFKTDAALRAALADEVDDAMVFIVAQRVTTIMHAHRIIVLDEGRIEGIGKHDELMEWCDVYREIVFSQLRGEEVA